MVLTLGSHCQSIPEAIPKESDKVQSGFLQQKCTTEYAKPSQLKSCQKLNPLQLNPCDDFFKYVCQKTPNTGGLISRHQPDAFKIAIQKIEQKKRDFINELLNRKQLSPKQQMIKNNIVACKDIKNAKVDEKKTIQDLIHQLDLHQNRKSLLAYISRLQSTGLESVIYFDLIRKKNDPGKMEPIFYSTMKSLPQHRDYNNDIKPEFLLLAKRFFDVLQLDRSEQRARWVWDFENEFMESFPAPSKFKSELEENYYWQKNQSHLANLNLFFDQMPSNVQIRKITEKNLIFINKFLGTAKLDQIKSLVIFQNFFLSSTLIDQSFVQERQRFYWRNFAMPNDTKLFERRCIDRVLADFSSEVDHELIHHSFATPNQQVIQDLYTQIERAIIQGIDRHPIFNSTLKSALTNKIKKINLALFYPRSTDQWNFLPEADYSLKNAFSNKRRVQENDYLRKRKLITAMKTNEIWPLGPLSVNAFYEPSGNRLYLPLGLFQEPIFSQKFDRQSNLAKTGFIIAHELGHAIDEIGFLYDSKGQKQPWLGDDDEKVLLQYHKKIADIFKLPQIHQLNFRREI